MTLQAPLSEWRCGFCDGIFPVGSDHDGIECARAHDFKYTQTFLDRLHELDIDTGHMEQLAARHRSSSEV